MSYSPKTVKEVDTQAFIQAYAKYLKQQGKVKVPSWADHVKTGTHKELAPYDPDWYFVRVAAVARRIYLRQGLGVGRLATNFGSRTRRGARTEHHHKASTSIIRKSIQALEKLGLVEKTATGGRRITDAGRRDLDLIAGRVQA